jgi:tetratricopeptide (TPR) repeat protein
MFLGRDHPDVGTTLKNLAELYRDAGRTDEAEPLYQRAVAIMENALGGNHPDVAEIRAGYLKLAHDPNQ